MPLVRIIELGCGNARLAHSLVLRHAGSQVVRLEMTVVQHAKNVSSQDRLFFVADSAEAVPFPGAVFDNTMTFKSLHHVLLLRLYNDEDTVRRAAQDALDGALTACTHWEAAQFTHFNDWAEFEQRMLSPSFVDPHIKPALVARVQAAFMPHMSPDGAHFVRPLHVRMLRRKD